MIKRLITQVVESISISTTTGSEPVTREEAIRMATAVLMIDVARADHVFEDSEFDRVLRLIEQHFGLTAEQAASLVNVADERAEDLVSLYEFTQLLHNNLDEAEKAKIVGLLWQIAYADGQLDKYEDYWC